MAKDTPPANAYRPLLDREACFTCRWSLAQETRYTGADTPLAERYAIRLHCVHPRHVNHAPSRCADYEREPGTD